MQPRFAVLVGRVLVVAAGALGAPAIASAATVGFDDQPAGTTIDTQYAASTGLSFVTTVPWYDPGNPATGTADDWTGLLPVVRADALAPSQPNAGDISGCSHEICSYRAQTFGTFSEPQQTVSLYVGDFGPSSETMDVDLTTYDRSGNQLGFAEQGLVGGGGYFALTNDDPSGQISYFRVRALNTGGDHIAIDSIALTRSPAPPTPAFDLLFSPPNPFALGLRPGQSQTAPLTVLRFGGSTGPLGFDFPGLPSDLEAQVIPNPADVGDGGKVSLRITAMEGAAPAVGVPVHVRARAIDPATAGSGSSTVNVPVTIVGGSTLHVSGVEVNQGVQEDLNNPPGAPHVSTPDGGLPKPPSFGAPAVYQGVWLVTHRKTIVRVYVNTGPRGQTISGATVTLSGTDSHGRPLPGSPLLPDFSPASVTSGPAFTTMSERTNTTDAYNFTVPPDWTDGTISLTANADLPGFLASASPISKFGSFTLTGVAFKPTGSWTITPLRGVIAGNSVPGPYSLFDGLRAILPIADGDLQLPSATKVIEKCPPVTGPCSYTEDPSTIPYMGDIGLQDIWNNACGLSPLKTPFCLDRTSATSDALDRLIDHEGDDDYAADTSVLAVEGPTQGLIGGVTRQDEDTKVAEEYPMSVVSFDQGTATSPDTRPLTDVAHEVGHGLGRAHAGQGCPGTAPGDPQEGTPWPPDDRGFIQGVGLDPRPSSGGAPGVYTSFKWNDYDFMSYCAPHPDQDPGVWISARYWNEIADFLHSHHPAHDMTAIARAAGVKPKAQVWANVDPKSGAVTINPLHAAYGIVARPDLESSIGYQAVLRTASGTVVANVPMEPDFTHVDGGGAVMSIKALIPIRADAAEVQVTYHGVVVASRRRSAHRPTVRIITPRHGQRTGAARATLVRWRSSSGLVDAAVDYSYDDGHHWRNIYFGPNAGTLRLPSSYFAGSRRARIRVTVNDGFDQASAVSARFSAAGHAPGVIIDSPASGQSLFNDDELYLAGEGFNDAYQPLRGRALRWYDGKRLLGYGNAIGVIGLRAGEHRISLQARDQNGRTSSVSVVVKLRQARPRLLRLIVPHGLSPRAQSLALSLQTSVPAQLIVAGRTFAVDRRLRRIVLAVRPSRKPLRLTLTLRAGQLLSSGVLVIPRS